MPAAKPPSAGRVATRTDASGTTSYGYDGFGRLISRASTAGGGTISYGYDKASNLTSVTDSRGTTSYSCDDAGELDSMTYLLNGAAKLLLFRNDDHGRRTDSWLQSNATEPRTVTHDVGYSPGCCGPRTGQPAAQTGRLTPGRRR